MRPVLIREEQPKMGIIREEQPKMGIAAWIAAGLIAGLVSRWVRVGGEPGGCFGSVALGIMGALAGGALATLLGFGGLLSFDGRSLLTALLGALLALLLSRLARRPR
jgi:uncharacterized membrane protein YeaQ/YmgE (transglycosylase-associated protein family)